MDHRVQPLSKRHRGGLNAQPLVLQPDAETMIFFIQNGKFSLQHWLLHRSVCELHMEEIRFNMQGSDVLVLSSVDILKAPLWVMLVRKKRGHIE